MSCSAVHRIFGKKELSEIFFVQLLTKPKIFDIIVSVTGISYDAAMAQLVEHILGKDEVPGPNPGSSSKKTDTLLGVCFFASTLALDRVHERAPVRIGDAERAKLA